VTRIAYRSEIDGLRAIAVLSVVLYHAGIGLRAGFVGVDLFFVISGYLITSLLHREWSTTKRLDLIGFYARRFRRVFPAMAVVVLGTVLVSAAALSPYGEIAQVTQSAAASLLFAGNLFFQTHTGGYFDPSAERMPLLHLWSLGVEEQFYLLWPLGFMVLIRWRRRSIFLIVALSALASLALAEVLIFKSPNAAFYQMPARFWELALGGLIALKPGERLSDSRLPAALGLSLVLMAIAFPIAHFPGLGALPAVAGAGLLLYAIHGSTRLGWTGAMLRSRPMVFCGLISYSLYLWHWPLLALVRATHAGPVSLELRLALCATAVMLAWLSFRLVEQPLRRPDPATSDRRVVAAGVLASVALACGAMTLGDALYRKAPPDDLASRTARDMPENRNQCNFRGFDPLDDFPRPDCNSSNDRPVKVAIWGDSHALAWQPFAWALAQHQGVAATSYTRDACAPVLDYDNGKRLLEARRCREFNQLVAGRIAGIDTLILTAQWPVDLAEADFGARFQATVERVAPTVKKIILLGPTPHLRDSVPQCIAAGNLPACALSRREFDAQSGAARALLKSLAAKYANVEYVELADVFCSAEICPAVKDGYGLYWDSNHVASSAARRFADEYLSGKDSDHERR